jgi:RNA polymerase-binding protein DksA
LLARYHDARERIDAELAETDPEEIERATEQWDAQVTSHLSDEDARALAAIVAALHRIKDGTYGCCSACGEWIGDARLTAVPATTTCIDCASSAERLKRVVGS